MNNGAGAERKYSRHAPHGRRVWLRVRGWCERMQVQPRLVSSLPGALSAGPHYLQFVLPGNCRSSRRMNHTMRSRVAVRGRRGCDFRFWNAAFGLKMRVIEFLANPKSKFRSPQWPLAIAPMNCKFHRPFGYDLRLARACGMHGDRSGKRLRWCWPCWSWRP